MDSGEEPKENLVEMDNGGGAEVATTQEDVLLGSFFDKNATCEDEERYKCYKHLDNNDAELSNEPADAEDTEESSSQCIDMPNTDNLNKTAQVLEPVKSETWLITPLPCLTSITELSQQRSMIDNDPLENLLIEHPSMSIFMSATAPPTSITASTTTTSNTTTNNTPLAISKRRNRKPISAHKSKFMQSDEICEINFLFTEAENSMPLAVVVVAEKRKESETTKAESSTVSPVSSLNESPKRAMRKSKKNKLNSKQLGVNNKENSNTQQVKTLLMSECFKANGKHDSSHGGNKTSQLRRANKNATFFSMLNNNANTRQRKFHNLQQPSQSSNLY
jgi:hypothetical protein